MTDVLLSPAKHTDVTAAPGPMLVLVATDGLPQSDGALAIGRQLLRLTDRLRLASVVAPMALVPESMLLFGAELDTERRAVLQRAIAAQTQRVWGTREPAALLDGDAGRSIARLARESDASLIVTGLGSHAIDDRIFGNETVLRIMRVADAPILAVTEALRHIPRRIVVAVDFSETSLQAARLAIQLAAPGASISLVHVAPHSSELYAWADLHRRNATDALERMLRKLGHVEGKHLQTLLLHGDPAVEVLAAAKKLNADLIAIGTHGHGLIARYLIGSVATKVVRSTQCSVLVFPQAAAFHLGRDLRETIVARGIAQEKWTPLLDDITWQNLGRPATLEIDDPAVGAQLQVVNRQFMGASYDHHDCQVSVMFGTSAPGGDHLTHVIGNVTAVDVLQNGDGKDVAVRISNGDGQSVLKFGSTGS